MMTDLLIEAVVISFTFGGIVGGVLALSLSARKKEVPETATEEKAQDILHP